MKKVVKHCHLSTKLPNSQIKILKQALLKCTILNCFLSMKVDLLYSCFTRGYLEAEE
jgi:hypothetical protein